MATVGVFALEFGLEASDVAQLLVGVCHLLSDHVWDAVIGVPGSVVGVEVRSPAGDHTVVRRVEAVEGVEGCLDLGVVDGVFGHFLDDVDL